MYYLLINNERSGPFSADEVRLYLQKGAIGNNTHFWCDGMMEWKTVGSSRHLFEPQMPPTAQYGQQQYQPQQQPLMFQQGIYSSKSRVGYILFGLFLGGLGIHNFYAGYAGRGIAQLLLNLFLFWTILVPIIIWIWVIIEIIVVDRDSNGNRFS